MMREGVLSDEAGCHSQDVGRVKLLVHRGRLTSVDHEEDLVVTPLRPHLLVTCDVDGHMFRAIMDTDSTITSGEKIAFAPIKDRIRWFDPKSQQRIA